MAHKNKRPFHASVGEKRVQLIGDPIRVARLRSELAPALASAIVRAHAGKLTDFRLDPAPHGRTCWQGGLENNGRAATAGAMDVEPVTTNIDELPGRWK